MEGDGETATAIVTASVAVLALVVAAYNGFWARKAVQLSTRQVAAQTRPILVEVPPGPRLDTPEVISFPLGRAPAEAIFAGEVIFTGVPPADDSKPQFDLGPGASTEVSIPVRNIGQGLARVVEAHIEAPPLALMPMLLASESVYVPAGDEVRLSMRVNMALYNRARHPTPHPKALLRVRYQDFAGERQPDLQLELDPQTLPRGHFRWRTIRV